MATLKTERRVFLWNLSPQPAPIEANKPVTLDDFIGTLEGALGSGAARVFLRGGNRILDDDDASRDEKNQLYVAKIDRMPDQNAISILINRGDPDAVSPAFLNANQNEVRVEHPTRAESPGWSAHLVIATELVGGTHRATFEQMPHVASRLVLDALDKIVARALAGNPAYRFDTVVYKGGRQRIVWKQYRPALVADRVPSERLVDDLNVGALRGVTLSRRTHEYAGPGMEEVIRSEAHQVVLRLHRASKTRVEQFLAGFLPQARADGFNSVTFHVDKLPGKQTSNPTLQLGDDDAMEQLYVRAKRIVSGQNFFEQCYSEPCEYIVTEMIAILNDQSNWQ